MDKSYDRPLTITTLVLVAIGWIMVYSSSAITADLTYQDGFKFLKRQLLFSFVGLVAMMAAMRIPYRWWQKCAYPLLGASLVLLVVVLIPGLGVSHQVGVARRWLAIPWFTMQPSEVGKLTLAIFISYSLTKKGVKMKEFTFGFLPVVLISGIMVLLVVLEPDMGTAVFLGTLTMVLLFLGGTRLSHLLLLPVVALPPFYALVHHFNYGYYRLLIFLNPWEDIQGRGFQIIQSFVALGAGGFWGVGLGDGRQKLFFLPAAHTDFVLAIVGEELGFLGILGIILFFALFVWRAILIAVRTEDAFGSYLAMGIGCMIGLQVLINMGVVVGLLPTKGLTLPFVSYGGTSLITNLAAVGILLNISTEVRRR